ncbi:radical SAM protein [Lutispora sp.]|uniref:radical SAM protein n=1 Tax=Lutispora sp. TaxID=2828727 RepID=UPI002B21DE4F|nr:radical SAM protein [Lutispora sp.]MEA4960161.1 radical SAM protein [Lutispora sp.]
MYVRWDITNCCNLKCIHCIVGDTICTKPDNELSLRTIFKIIDVLKEKYHVNFIHFLGGEPFAKEGFLDIFKYCNYRNIVVGITTNGTLLNEEYIKKIAEGISLGCSITLSLDGPNNETNDIIRGNGSFDKCINSLSALSQYKKNVRKLQIGIGATINRINIDALDEYIYLADKYNIDTIGFDFIISEGNAVKNADKLIIKDDFMILKAADRIFKAYANSPQTFSLNLPFPPKLIEILNKKYGCDVKIKNGACMALNDGIYIDSKGKCILCDFGHIVRELKNIGILNDSEIDILEEDNIYDSQQLLKLKQFLKSNIEKKRDLLKSKNCRFAGYCIGCPATMGKDVNCNICEKAVLEIC